jgi:hypothetical protein
LSAKLADPLSGACCDGLQQLGLNRNQGAESTLAYLWMAVLNFEVQSQLGNDRANSANRFNTLRATSLREN